ALVEILTLTDSDAKYEGKSNSGNDVLSGLPILCDSDALSVVLTLAESERLVLVEPLNDVLALAESLTLVDDDSLSDVLALVESLTLVDVDPLNDVLAL
ncbi:hypothetical protein, partial [Staphylococcus hominis]